MGQGVRSLAAFFLHRITASRSTHTKESTEKKFPNFDVVCPFSATRFVGAISKGRDMPVHRGREGLSTRSEEKGGGTAWRRCTSFQHHSHVEALRHQPPLTWSPTHCTFEASSWSHLPLRSCSTNPPSPEAQHIALSSHLGGIVVASLPSSQSCIEPQLIGTSPPVRASPSTPW